jgi:hypothetical protein
VQVNLLFLTFFVCCFEIVSSIKFYLFKWLREYII